MPNDVSTILDLEYISPTLFHHVCKRCAFLHYYRDLSKTEHRRLNKILQRYESLSLYSEARASVTRDKMRNFTIFSAMINRLNVQWSSYDLVMLIYEIGPLLNNKVTDECLLNVS